MHPHDIKGFARKVALQKLYGGKGIKVFIKAKKDGETFWMTNQGFRPDKANAKPFDFDADGVADQVFQVACQTGQLLDVVPVEETADQKSRRLFDENQARQDAINRHAMKGGD